MTINEAQDEVIEEFSDLTDWMDKYQMLIDLGNELNELDEKYKTEQNLIDGCQSRVWLQCDERGGKLFFTADSDALIVKGIIALLIRVISGHTPKEILDADLYFIDRIGLREHLSPTRSNGLLAMVKQIKAYALALQREGRRVTGMRRLFFFITNGSRWFELADLYAADSQRISPLLRDFSKAMLDQMFNRPRQAISSIRTLLRRHQTQLGGGNVASMMFLMATDYSKLNRQDSAAWLLETFLDQTKDSPQFPLRDQARRSLDVYRALSAYRLFGTDGQQHYELPLRLDRTDSVGMLFMVPCSFNGKASKACFDTGASYNVISTQLARKWGLRPVAHGVQVEGTARGEGDVVVADSISMGNLTMRNVPFVVLDLQANNTHAQSLMGSLELIIGQPFLTRFARYVIDLERRAVFLYTDTVETHEKPTLCLPNSLHAKVSRNGRVMDFAMDSGSTTSSLGTDYYRDFQSEVLARGKWDIHGSAGYGGVSYNSVFVMPEVSLSIGSMPFALKKVEVVAMSSHEGALTRGYGRLGNDFMQRWARVEIDNVNMVITLTQKKTDK